MFWNQNSQNKPAMAQSTSTYRYSFSTVYYTVVQIQRSQIAKYVPELCGTLTSIAIYSFTECMFLVHTGEKKKKWKQGKNQSRKRKKITLHTHSQSISQTNFHSICKEHMVNSQIKYSSLLNKSSILINLMRFLLSYSSFHSIRIVLVHYIENQKWMRIETNTAQRICPWQRWFNLWMCTVQCARRYSFFCRSRFSCILIHSSLLDAFVTIK